MGSLFTSKGTQNTNQTGSSTPTFGKQGQSILDYLQGNLMNNKTTGDESTLRGVGTQGLLDAFNGSPAQIDASQALENIRKASDAQTQNDIVAARSKFYNRPTGRNDIAVADTVARNAANRDQALGQTQLAADQFNANAINTANQNKQLLSQYLNQYSNAETNQQNQKNSQLMQLLSLLRGESTTGTGSGSSTSTGTPFESILKVLGTVGGAMAMCWVARAAFGNNPIWLVYREYMLTKAPLWYQIAYLTLGPAFAQIVKRSEWLKKQVRKAMLPAIREIISN